MNTAADINTVSSNGQVTGVVRSENSILKPRFHLRCLEQAKSFSHLYRHIANEMVGMIDDPQLLTQIAFKVWDSMKEETY